MTFKERHTGITGRLVLVVLGAALLFFLGFFVFWGPSPPEPCGSEAEVKSPSGVVTAIPRERQELERAAGRLLQRLATLSRLEVIDQRWEMMRCGDRLWPQWHLHGKYSDPRRFALALRVVRDYLRREFSLNMLLQVEPEAGYITFLVLDARQVVFIGRFAARDAVSFPSPEPAACLSVVIDDLGRDLVIARSFVRLPFPLTGAVLPKLKHSVAVADLLNRAGCDVLLHLPMEPRDYPEVDPGPGALFLDMPPAQMMEVTRENLSGLPGLVGVNNHMGSRFTADAVAVSRVLRILREQGLFFLDSRTFAGSVAYDQALKMGLPALQRDVFLDNVRDVDHILLQIKHLLEVARIRGRAIAIGHPYPETLKALQALPDMAAAAGVEMLPLHAMLTLGKNTNRDVIRTDK